MTQQQTPFESIFIRSFTLALAVVLAGSVIFSPTIALATVSARSVSYTAPSDLARLPLADGFRESEQKTVVVVATAYSSTPDQTDDSPFVSANGTWVYHGMVAANFLPFGTLVRFPDVFGDKIFRVDDRMNSRYGRNRVDLWVASRETAQLFGVQSLKMEIVGRQYTLARK